MGTGQGSQEPLAFLQSVFKMHNTWQAAKSTGLGSQRDQLTFLSVCLTCESQDEDTDLRGSV